MTANNDALPELPTPYGPWHATSDDTGYYTYTDDQMRDYARAAIRALSADRGEAIAEITGTYGGGGHVIWPKGGELPIGTKLYLHPPSPAEGAAPCQCAECRRKGALNRMGSPFVMDPLPTHDPAKSNAEQGLYRKFDVRRTDGSDAPGGKHHGCDYFVLDVGHDPLAKAALTAYAAAAQSTHPDLARDMIERYGLSAAPSGVSDAMVETYSTAVAEHLGKLTPEQWEVERADHAAAIRRVVRVGLTAVFAAQPQPGRVEGMG